MGRGPAIAINSTQHAPVTFGTESEAFVVVGVSFGMGRMRMTPALVPTHN